MPSVSTQFPLIYSFFCRIGRSSSFSLASPFLFLSFFFSLSFFFVKNGTLCEALRRHVATKTAVLACNQLTFSKKRIVDNYADDVRDQQH